MKSVEQKLYEAYRNGKAVQLSAFEVVELIGRDDAIRTRITNAACGEAGISEAGEDAVGRAELTWHQFKKLLKEGTGE